MAPPELSGVHLAILQLIPVRPIVGFVGFPVRHENSVVFADHLFLRIPHGIEEKLIHLENVSRHVEFDHALGAGDDAGQVICVFPFSHIGGDLDDFYLFAEGVEDRAICRLQP